MQRCLLMNRLNGFTRIAWCMVGMLLAGIAGCSSVEKAKPVPQSARVDPEVKVNVPEIMRGTIASEAILLGHGNPGQISYRPIIVRGYGLVVGLNGTGSS